MAGGLEISPAVIREKIQEAEERKARALAEYEAAEAELGWWRDGLRVFGEGEVSDPSDGARITEVFPNARFFKEHPGIRPTLRQAIIATMAETPAMHYRVTDLVAVLERRGWLPDRDDAQKRISDMAGVMASEGQLYRVTRGVYSIDPQLAAMIELEGQKHE